MGVHDLPDMYYDMYARSLGAKDMHIRQITNAHVTTTYYVSLCFHSNNTSGLESHK